MLVNDIHEIRRTLEIFKRGKLIEIRTIGKYAKSGYFKNTNSLIECVRKYQDETFYFVLNEIKDDCYGRVQNEKLTGNIDSATKDDDISRREWILIDADPRRVSGVSATDEEKARAWSVLMRVRNYLHNTGLSPPIVADSGNGYHSLYRIDTKNDPAKDELIKKFLQALDMLFSDDYVEIDIRVYNASRITKLYGTIARKGTNTPERPYRPSRLLEIPGQIVPTSIALIEKVAALIPEPSKPSKTTKAKASTSRFDIEEFIKKHGIRIAKVGKCSAGIKYVLEECAFDPNHKAPDAAIIVLNSGALVYKCFHNSCQHNTWRDFRLQYEPYAYDDTEGQPSRVTSPQPVILRQEPTPKPNAQKFLQLQDIKRRDRSQIVSIPSGIHALDKRIIGFNKGELTIWSGGNGSGKSTFLSQLALETISRGFKVAMFSGELTSDRVKNWIHLQAAGRIYNQATQYEGVYETPKDIGRVIDLWTCDKLWVYNNDFGTEVNSVLNDIIAHIEKHHTDAVLIDNLMAFDLSKVQGEKYDRQSALVLMLSNMAKQQNAHIHFVCHPRKPTGFLRKADISGTADLTNAADNVIMLHRVNIDFQKQSKDFFAKGKAEKYFGFTNVLEIMKNRDLGVQDELVGLYFEKESKRLLNAPFEPKSFGWDDFVLYAPQGVSSYADKTSFY